MFGDRVRSRFSKTQDVVSDTIGAKTPEQLPTAGEAIARELSGMLDAGSTFIPPAVEPEVPAVDSDGPRWHPPLEPMTEVPVPRYTDADVQRVVVFIGRCGCPVTRNEIGGGTGLGFDILQTLLPELVTDGVLQVVSGDTPNYARYGLAPSVPKPTTETETPVMRPPVPPIG